MPGGQAGVLIGRGPAVARADLGPAGHAVGAPLDQSSRVAPAEPLQLRLIWVVEAAVAVRLIGAAGADGDPRLGDGQARGGVGDRHRLRCRPS